MTIGKQRVSAVTILVGLYVAWYGWFELRMFSAGGTGQDPVVAAASLVMALQSIVSRNVDPLHAAVVTVGALQAGQANNVIPASARLELSVRALDPSVRVLLEQRIKALVAAQAESFGVRAEVAWRQG